MSSNISCVTPALPPVTSSSNYKENFIDISAPQIRPTITSVVTVAQNDSALVGGEEKQNVAIPVVKLQVDTISDALASRLASSLLSMILFLKNQIPLPVPQLVRMSGKNSNLKAIKQRTELLSAYDTLSSHLATTFSSLSMALAETRNDGQKTLPSLANRAYLAILLGPTIGTAKSKVFLGVDHLQVASGPPSEETASEEDELESSSESEESEAESQGESEDEEGPSDSESEDDGDGEEDEDVDENDSEPHKEGTTEETNPTSQLPDALELDKKFRGSPQLERKILEAPSAPKPDARQPRLVPPAPSTLYAEEQRFLQNADRLLSRTLAASDAEGFGLASEMSTTQTHVLIRAPRNFFHPAWVPQQNVTGSLDKSLKTFLAETTSESTSPIPTPPPLKNSRKQRTEGIWLATKNGLGLDSRPLVLEENEDMIWWSWDGKLIGFSNW